MQPILLNGETLTIDQVIAVAYGQPGQPAVQLSESAQAQVNRAAQAVERLLNRGEVAYGITTGFGAFKDRIISKEQVVHRSLAGGRQLQGA